MGHWRHSRQFLAELATAPCEHDRLIEANLGYARRLAARIARRLPRSVDVEELESDAYLGLLKAAESFDSGLGRWCCR